MEGWACVISKNIVLDCTHVFCSPASSWNTCGKTTASVRSGGSSEPVEGITEDRKAENRMEWVRRMNAIRHQGEEILLAELVFA